MFAFKRFNFFSQADVTNHAFPRNFTCCVPGPVHLYVGCDGGSVVALDESLQQAFSFNAHGSRVLEMAWLQQVSCTCCGPMKLVPKGT